MIFLAFYRTKWKPPAIGVIDRFRIAEFRESIPENARADHFVPLNKKMLRVAIGCFTVAGPLFVILTQTISQPNDVIIGLTLALFVLFFWALCQIPMLLISHRIASQEA